MPVSVPVPVKNLEFCGAVAVTTRVCNTPNELSEAPGVYQPTLAPASMAPVAMSLPTPAPVIEKIYLRDQGVQSDPPAIQGRLV